MIKSLCLLLIISTTLTITTNTDPVSGTLSKTLSSTESNTDKILQAEIEQQVKAEIAKNLGPKKPAPAPHKGPPGAKPHPSVHKPHHAVHKLNPALRKPNHVVHKPHPAKLHRLPKSKLHPVHSLMLRVSRFFNTAVRVTRGVRRYTRLRRNLRAHKGKLGKKLRFNKVTRRRFRTNMRTIKRKVFRLRKY